MQPGTEDEMPRWTGQVGTWAACGQLVGRDLREPLFKLELAVVFAKGAVLQTVRDRGECCFLSSLSVSYLPPPPII